eukprot:gb/GECH01011340.1/.p1 GENE.gb/GECH01011340.1/~~gb/GECH01011340.1/.p1  ORF type:complete len:152 (+),score=16.66 gb/GECH01011340.1/:1-456(+)
MTAAPNQQENLYPTYNNYNQALETPLQRITSGLPNTPNRDPNDCLVHVNLIEKSEYINEFSDSPIKDLINLFNVVYRYLYWLTWTIFMLLLGVIVSPFVAIAAALADVFVTIAVRPFAKIVGKIARDSAGFSEPVNYLVRREQRELHSKAV